MSGHGKFRLHCVLKNDTDVAHYNFDTHQPILVIFVTDVAESMLSNISEKLPKSVNVRRNYSMLHRCRFLRHSVYCLMPWLHVK